MLILGLKEIKERLIQAQSVRKRLQVLTNSKEFRRNYSKESVLAKLFQRSSLQEKIVIAAIIVCGQAPVVFREIEKQEKNVKNLLSSLWEVEQFYQEMGGLVGYHLAVHELLKNKPDKNNASETLLKPVGWDLQRQTDQTNLFVRWGIESLPKMAEIYPVGGAGDRLDLRDEKTGVALPAASLNFAGSVLLKSLITDLQAREYLHYKLIGENTITPVALMTSDEKNNREEILKICERNHFFGRPKELFFIFNQPLVPVITVDGCWVMADKLEPRLKPGGHGVIWKLAKQSGLFTWVYEKKRKHALVRQINNPVAGVDFGILAFCGIGVKREKAFGVCSCPRLLNTAQGMLALIKKVKSATYSYHLSNIEYTDFSKKNLQDLPEKPGSPYSKFPANTNILFVDLKTIERTLSKCPFPGTLVNFKKEMPYIDESGVKKKAKAGRLESTMQNISDYIIDHFDHGLSEQELLELKSFITYNERKKTISVTKKSFDPKQSPLETPIGCFYEVLENNLKLLSTSCHVDLPSLVSLDEYLKEGPNLLFLYHPALGPLYSVIAQKIRGGRFFNGFELQLRIAELFMQNCELDGSLTIEATEPIGRKKEGILTYSEQSGKCELVNIKVTNRGIDRKSSNIYWQGHIEREECLHIILHGNAEFFAENVHFKGHKVIEVPDGYRLTAIPEKGGGIAFKREEITEPTWFWRYFFKKDNSIKIEKQFTVVV